MIILIFYTIIDTLLYDLTKVSMKIGNCQDIFGIKL